VQRQSPTKTCHLKALPTTGVLRPTELVEDLTDLHTTTRRHISLLDSKTRKVGFLAADNITSSFIHPIWIDRRTNSPCRGQTKAHLIDALSSTL